MPPVIVTQNPRVYNETRFPHRKRERLSEMEIDVMDMRKAFEQSVCTPVLRLEDCTVYDGGQLQFIRQWDGDRLNMTMTNCSNKTLKVKEIVLYSGPAPFAPDTEIYGEGYNMLTQYSGTLEKMEVIGSYGMDREFFRFPDTPFNKDLSIIYNMMMFFPKNQDVLLMAFSSCNRFMGEFRFKGDYLEVVVDTENLPLDPGESWRFEEVSLQSGPDKNVLLQNLAKAIERKGTRFVSRPWTVRTRITVVGPEPKVSAWCQAVLAKNKHEQE